MKTIRTDVEGWQYDCLELAKTGKPFEIADYDKDRHYEFCTALSKSYGYALRVNKVIVTFLPTKNA